VLVLSLAPFKYETIQHPPTPPCGGCRGVRPLRAGDRGEVPRSGGFAAPKSPLNLILIEMFTALPLCETRKKEDATKSVTSCHFNTTCYTTCSIVLQRGRIMSLFFIQRFSARKPPNPGEPIYHSSCDCVADEHQQTISRQSARRKFYQNVQHVQERYQQNHRLFFWAMPSFLERLNNPAQANFEKIIQNHWFLEIRRAKRTASRFTNKKGAKSPGFLLQSFWHRFQLVWGVIKGLTHFHAASYPPF